MIVVSLMSGLFNSKFRRVNFLRTFYGDLHSLLLGLGPGVRADQPRGIDVSFLYRNAGWALQAGICWRGLTSITTHTSEVLGIKVITIWWPSTSTDHNRDFGPGVGSFEARIAGFESCPKLPFR